LLYIILLVGVNTTYQKLFKSWAFLSTKQGELLWPLYRTPGY